MNCFQCGSEIKTNKKNRKYCGPSCYHQSRSGQGCHFWHGGKTIDKTGYVLIMEKTHPHSNPNGYIREHRIIMEKYLGRLLGEYEVVHHINGVKDDNRIENLELYDNHSKHLIREWSGGNRKMTRWGNL